MVSRFIAVAVSPILLWISAPLRAELPPSYDLRLVDVGGGVHESWVPAIQDQGEFGDCWTFASATAINSNLLKNNLLGPAVEHPPEIQVSSWHLSVANGAPEGLLPPNYGGNGVSSWGGFEYQALGYLTRGSGSWAIPAVPSPTSEYITTLGGGVVLNSANPANAYPHVLENHTPDLRPYLPPTQQAIAFQTRSVTMLDQGFSTNVALPTFVDGGYDFDQGAEDLQVQAVKAAILDNGAVTTTMRAAYSFFSYSPAANENGDYTVYYNNAFSRSQSTGDSAHEVTIIGWDDTRQVFDKEGNVTATGAWHVQNSWGKNEWGGVDKHNDGTFWVSYNDPIIGRVGVASFDMTQTGSYSQTPLQNELGPMAYANDFYDGQGPLGMAQDSHTTVASLLTPTEEGQLIALGLASQAATKVTISLYSGWLAGPDSFLFSQDFTFDSIGYQLVDLNMAVDLMSGDPIVVQLVYESGNAAPIVIGGDGLNGYLDVASGLSFYYDEGDMVWKDFADETYYGWDNAVSNGGVLFMKGYTAVPEPAASALIALAILGFLITRKQMAHRGRI